MTFEAQRMRNGELATIYCRDAPGEWPIHGRDKKGMARSWRADGRWRDDGTDHHFDLMPSEPKVLWQRWDNIYPHGRGGFYASLLQAVRARRRNCLSTIRIYLLEGEKVPRTKTIWENGDDDPSNI